MAQITADHGGEEVRGHGLPLPAASADTPTPGDAIAAYREWLARTPDLRPTTKLAYDGDLRQFPDAMSSPDPLLLMEIDERHVEAWKSHMTDLKAVTVRRKLVSLSRFFRWARQQRLVTLDHVEFVKKPRKPREVHTSLSLEHFELLLAACKTPSERALLGCLLWAGCRRQEVVDLNVGSVDLAEELIRIEGKGGDARQVPIAGRLAVLLAEHLRGRGDAVLSGPLFAKRDGGRLSLRSINGWFGSLCKRAGPEQQRYTPHSARRGIAALMADQGFSIFDLQAFMGHEDPKTTARYAQASAGTIRARMASSVVFAEEPGRE